MKKNDNITKHVHTLKSILEQLSCFVLYKKYIAPLVFKTLKIQWDDLIQWQPNLTLQSKFVIKMCNS
jgi:hypothetical protein